MQNYNNGHVMDVRKIPTTDYETAAREWSEGSKALEELLLYCLKNNIITQACCAGHDDIRPYLQFELSEKNIGAITKIINRFYNLNGIEMSFCNEPGFLSKFIIKILKNNEEQIFKDMLIELSNGLKVQTDSLPMEIQIALDVIFKHKIPDSFIEIVYKICNGEKKMLIATNFCFYSGLLIKNKNAMPWINNAIAIEDSPENIISILNEISKKIPKMNEIFNEDLQDMSSEGLYEIQNRKLKIIDINNTLTKEKEKKKEFAIASGICNISLVNAIHFTGLDLKSAEETQYLSSLDSFKDFLKLFPPAIWATMIVAAVSISNYIKHKKKYDKINQELHDIVDNHPEDYQNIVEYQTKNR